jgi:hypothetical protein
MLQTIKWLMTLAPGAAKRSHKEDAIFGSLFGILSYVDLEMQHEMLAVLLPPELVHQKMIVENIWLWEPTHRREGNRQRPDGSNRQSMLIRAVSYDHFILPEGRR